MDPETHRRCSECHLVTVLAMSSFLRARRLCGGGGNVGERVASNDGHDRRSRPPSVANVPKGGLAAWLVPPAQLPSSGGGSVVEIVASIGGLHEPTGLGCPIPWPRRTTSVEEMEDLCPVLLVPLGGVSGWRIFEMTEVLRKRAIQRFLQQAPLVAAV
jgi:hypothetical protein